MPFVCLPYPNGRRWSREWYHTDPTMLLIVAALRDTRYLVLSCAELYIFGLRPGIAWFHPDVLHACNHGLITIGVMHARLINIDHPHQPSAAATATAVTTECLQSRRCNLHSMCPSRWIYMCTWCYLTGDVGPVDTHLWYSFNAMRRSPSWHGGVSRFVITHK